MDNFYNSPALARKLKTLGFDCVGTLRTNRQFVPQELTNLTKATMRPGQIEGLTSGDVDLLVWRDQNRVGMISTYHGNAVAQIKGVTKPTLIHEYNSMMGGVDKKDQMLAAFPIERKRTKVWYKKVFRRLLNVSILNGYVICKCSNSIISHRLFRTSIINTILERHSPLHLTAGLLQSQITPNVTAVIKNHHLAPFEFGTNTKGRKRRVCVVCKKRTTTYCVGCKKPVCMHRCFVSLH